MQTSDADGLRMHKWTTSLVLWLQFYTFFFPNSFPWIPQLRCDARLPNVNDWFFLCGPSAAPPQLDILYIVHGWLPPMAGDTDDWDIKSHALKGLQPVGPNTPAQTQTHSWRRICTFVPSARVKQLFAMCCFLAVITNSTIYRSLYFTSWVENTIMRLLLCVCHQNNIHNWKIQSTFEVPANCPPGATTDYQREFQHHQLYRVSRLLWGAHWADGELKCDAPHTRRSGGENGRLCYQRCVTDVEEDKSFHETWSAKRWDLQEE